MTGTYFRCRTCDHMRIHSREERGWICNMCGKRYKPELPENQRDYVAGLGYAIYSAVHSDNRSAIKTLSLELNVAVAALEEVGLA